MIRLRLNSIIYTVTVCCLLFSSLYILGGISRQTEDIQDVDQLYEFEKRLSVVEDGVKKNLFAIKEVEADLGNLLNSGKITTSPRVAPRQGDGKTVGKILEADCQATKPGKKNAELLMRDVYRQIPFENRDGGVWKQGWEVTYDDVRSRWDKGNKLKVFVMPHSHNDPGWIKTYEKYYEDQTRHIFNNMVKKLAEDGSRKFIWAEISYLFLFWNEIPKETQEELKKLLDKGQLEIVTGGWVMNDEANTHYYAIIEQLAAGHEWMMNNLNVKPKSGLSIDPFGLSPTMAYLSQRMGFDQMVIQRAHYEVKKAFAWNKTLEFQWRQAWDPEDTTDILTHLMPFYSYDIPHTCGPDPKICCQFDFRRMRGSGMSCPWRVPPIPITPENVEQRAQLLLDQWRKKSTLYKTNALLIPLGDDFRYNTEEEWDNQFKNYKKLFEFMNAQEDWHVQAQFGTLSDYFEEVRRESARLSPIGVSDASHFFPSFSGDFFTYADERDHYWSGYYTSRPFYKNMDRVLEHYLRSADMLFSMMWSHMESVGVSQSEWTTELMELLTMGRRNLSLFQHHDGVTGTAKDHVMNDYGNKMFNSIRAVKSVISQVSHFMLSSEQANYKPDINEIHFHVDGEDHKYNSPSRDRPIQIDEAGDLVRLVYFNSLPRSREEMVTIQVSRHDVKILDEHRKPIRFQISPQFSDRAELSNNVFDISFLAEIPALGLMTYYVSALDDNEEQDMTFCSIAKIRVVGADVIPYSVEPFNDIKILDVIEPFTLKNRYIAAKFGENGLLKSIKTLDDGIESKIVLSFAEFGVKQSQPTSGAYLFIPDGAGTEIDLKNPVIRLVEGPLVSWVQVQFDEGIHEVKICDSPGVDGIGLDITNYVDITQRYNFELAMRFSTDVNSGNTFYTDLNGFQITRRERFRKLPVQANFYPMPAMAYLEDERMRFSLITAQPLGVSSQKTGELEVMLDRRLGQDDSRGLAQGVTDNIKFTPLRFRILLERKKKDCHEFDRERMDSYPSISAHLAAQSLFYPVVKMASPGAISKSLADRALRRFRTQLAPSQTDLACDIHLLHLRTSTERGPGMKEVNLPSNKVALTMHRLGFDCCFKPVGLKCGTNGGKFSVVDLFPEYFEDTVQQMSLTLLHPGKELKKSFVVSLRPMELYTFQLHK